MIEVRPANGSDVERIHELIVAIRGLNGYEVDGIEMPESFEGQGRLIWQHIGSLLRSADMGYANIVSLRTYLAKPEFDEPNIALRKTFLGDNTRHQQPSVVSFWNRNGSWCEAVAAA